MVKATDGFSCKGRSLLEILWEELDDIMDRLMADGKPARRGSWDGPGNHDEWRAFTQSWLEYGEERGQAQGVAYAIAVIENPYQPSVPNVKARAVDRWEERQKE